MPEVKPSALESMKLTFPPCLCFVCLLACFSCHYLTYLAVVMSEITEFIFWVVASSILYLKPMEMVANIWQVTVSSSKLQ